MVCSKCQKLSKGTTLATPGVKKKTEMYHGSPAASSSKSATQGQTGIGKVSKDCSRLTFLLYRFCLEMNNANLNGDVEQVAVQ